MKVLHGCYWRTCCCLCNKYLDRFSLEHSSTVWNLLRATIASIHAYILKRDPKSILVSKGSRGCTLRIKPAIGRRIPCVTKIIAGRIKSRNQMYIGFCLFQKIKSNPRRGCLDYRNIIFQEAIVICSYYFLINNFLLEINK